MSGPEPTVGRSTRAEAPKPSRPKLSPPTSRAAGERAPDSERPFWPQRAIDSR